MEPDEPRGSEVGTRIRYGKLPELLLVAALAALVALSAWRSVRDGDALPERRIAVERIVRATPEDAWIIAAIDPAYLYPFAGGHRRFVPISRQVEYASKLIARRRIDRPDPPPQFWGDHRAAGLFRGGAEEAVARVADESIERMGMISGVSDDQPSTCPVWSPISTLYVHAEGTRRAEPAPAQAPEGKRKNRGRGQVRHRASCA